MFRRFIELMQSRLPVDILMSTRRVFLGVLLRHGTRRAGRLRARLVHAAFARFIDPLINFFRALPPIALILW